MSDEEDIPPLEDMSELLQQVHAVREQKPAKDLVPDQHIQKRDDTKQVQPQSEAKLSSTNQQSEKPMTFGGMKKGFLFGGTNKAKAKSMKSPEPALIGGSGGQDPIPLIKPRDPEAKNKQHEIKEVQEAMNKDWMTEDLLSKVQNNEALLRGMSNPHFMQALAEFQTNPQAAMSKYEHNPEMQKFLKDFCGTLGDHFMTMGGDQPVGSGQTGCVPGSIITPTAATQGADISVHSSTNPNQATAEDEEKMQKILADPEIREILMDSQIQKLIDLLRTNPDNAQRLLQNSDTQLQMKIRKLVNVGLLQFQR